MAVLDTLCRARKQGGQSVVLVPENVYGNALRVLAGLYLNAVGRSALQPDGSRVFVLYPGVPVGDLSGPFNLYLAGWGEASPKDERELLKWIARATQVYTEVT